MRTLGIWAVGIVAGGIALGAMLGAASDPDMKDPPAPWWQQDDDYRLASPEPAFADSDLSLSSPFGGYRPDLDYDAEVWAQPIADYEMAPLFDDFAAPTANAMFEAAIGSLAAEDAADEAEAAASDALAAATPEPAPAEVRKSELARAGLY